MSTKRVLESLDRLDAVITDLELGSRPQRTDEPQASETAERLDVKSARVLKLVRVFVVAGFVLGCSSPPSQNEAQARAAMTACGVDSAAQPSTLSECEATCYVKATCIEITGRVKYPQAGEVDGTMLYSNLDVCIAGCQ